jgi:predicted transcriptional regulator
VKESEGPVHIDKSLLPKNGRKMLAREGNFRTEILDFVQNNPGITQLEIQERVPIVWSSVNYHVHKLLIKGKIKSLRLEPALHLFSPEIPDKLLPAIAALRRANAESIVGSLDSPKQLFEIQNELELGKNVVRAQIARLKEAEVIESEGFRRPIYRVNESKLELVRKFFSGTTCE